MAFRGRDNWHDMSDYVVHFTKPRESDPLADGGYSPMMSILGDGTLRTGSAPLGAARRISDLGSSQHVVCFSEIPLDRLARLLERRSRYGIGFRKDVLVEKGGSPLWYLDRDSPHAAAVRDIINSKAAAGIDPDDPFWKLAPLIDHPRHLRREGLPLRVGTRVACRGQRPLRPGRGRVSVHPRRAPR